MNERQAPKRQSSFPLFSQNFVTHPQDVIQYAYAVRTQMEDFIEAFRKRIEVEISYAKGLVNVSKSLDKYIMPGTQSAISFICSAFKVEHEQRSRQVIDLASSLKTQIQFPRIQALKNYTTIIKKMQKDFKRFYKQAQNVENNHYNALSAYQGINKDMEEMIITKNITKYTSGIAQEKKLKLIAKTMDSIKHNKTYQKLYLQSVRAYNQFAENYNKQIKIQLNQAENLIRQEVIVQADCLRKLIVAEVSMFKNIQYDILNISKQMENLNVQKDVQLFVQEHKNNQSNKIIADQIDMQNNPKISGTSWLNSRSNDNLGFKKPIAKSLLIQSLQNVQEDYFGSLLSNKKSTMFRECILKIWKKLRENIANNKIKSPIEPKESDIGCTLAVKINEAVSINNCQLLEQTQDTAENYKEQSIQQMIPVYKDQQIDKLLSEVIKTLKIREPPNFISQNQNIEKALSHHDIQTKFKLITHTIAILWNNSQLTANAFSNAISLLSAQLAEHHIYRLIALMFVEQYRIQQQVIINDIDNAKVCGQVIKVLIVQSLKKNDIFIIRGVLGLIFTFYWNQDKNKNLLYQIPQIYECEAWKKTDFWQAAIFQTTYQQMATFKTQAGQDQEETMLRQKNMIFSQLASYCHYMIMLGMAAKNVRTVVGRYCRLYEMTEQNNKDLSRMITNTNKQYRQTFLPNMQKGSEKQQSVISD